MEKACVALQKTAQRFRRQGDETKDLQQLPALETNKDSKELEPSANIPHKIWKKQQCRKAWKRSKQLGKQQKSFLDVIMQDMTLEDAYYYMNHFHDLEQRIEVLAQRQVPCCKCVTARCLGLLCGCWPDVAESTSFQAGNYLHRNDVLGYARFWPAHTLEVVFSQQLCPKTFNRFPVHFARWTCG